MKRLFHPPLAKESPRVDTEEGYICLKFFEAALKFYLTNTHTRTHMHRANKVEILKFASRSLYLRLKINRPFCRASLRYTIREPPFFEVIELDDGSGAFISRRSSRKKEKKRRRRDGEGEEGEKKKDRVVR